MSWHVAGYDDGSSPIFWSATVAAMALASFLFADGTVGMYSSFLILTWKNAHMNKLGLYDFGYLQKGLTSFQNWLVFG